MESKLECKNDRGNECEMKMALFRACTHESWHNSAEKIVKYSMKKYAHYCLKNVVEKVNDRQCFVLSCPK